MSNAYLAQVFEEVERVYPEYERNLNGITDLSWWTAVGPVEPCETCGTRVFLIEDRRGHRRWCQVGYLHGEPTDMKVRLLYHTPKVCKEKQLELGAVDLNALFARLP